MNYNRMTNDELSRCKYPNLMAEIIESGYSTSTIADFMGIGAKKNGRYREQEDPEVWGMINGLEELCYSHMKGLCFHYHASFDYLFSDTLQIIEGKPAAYWKWYDENQKQQKEYEGLQALFKIYQTLNDKQYLIGYVQKVINYIDGAEDPIEAATMLMQSLE